MSTEAQLLAVAPSWRRSTKDKARLQRSSQGSTGDATYWVKLSELDDALDVIEGLTETVELAPGVTVQRKVPLQHYRQANLYADGFDVEEYESPEADDPSFPYTGSQAKVRVLYKAPEFPINGSQAYQRVNGRGFQLELQGSNVTFSGGGTPSYDVQRLVPGLSYQLQVLEAPGVSEATEAYWAVNAGKVNAGPFRGNAAGTVLFHSPTFDYVMKRDGSVVCNYGLQLDVLAVPWNQGYKRNGSLGTVQIGGAPRYASLDFNTLFY